MKLRNKKTGEIGYAIFINKDEAGSAHTIRMRFSGIYYEFNTLEEINNVFEDYTPAEPLIKDEKIRKAVRAWAEVLEVNEVESYGSRDWIGLLAKYDGADWSSKFELDCCGSENTLVPDKKYTIAELCGDEEE